MKSNKNLFYIPGIVLGILFSYVIHGLIEIFYLKIIRNQSSVVVWNSHFGLGSCALPLYLQYGLFIAGILGGFLIGKYLEQKR